MSVADTLIPDKSIAGYEVRPWSLGQIVKVGPLLADVMATAEAIDFDLDGIFDGKFSQTKLARLVLTRLDTFVDILSVSLTQPREELEKIDAGDAVQLVRAVVTLNIDHLKNSFAPPAGDGAKNTTKTRTKR